MDGISQQDQEVRGACPPVAVTALSSGCAGSSPVPGLAADALQSAGATCEFCAQPDSGESWYPLYGVAPHECYWRKGAEFAIGQSTLLPPEQWEPGFVPDLEDDETWADFKYPSACGVYYCPKCQHDQYLTAWNGFVAKFGLPPASGIEGEAGDPQGLHPEGESPVPKADAQPLDPKGQQP